MDNWLVYETEILFLQVNHVFPKYLYFSIIYFKKCVIEDMCS